MDGVTEFDRTFTSSVQAQQATAQAADADLADLLASPRMDEDILAQRSIELAAGHGMAPCGPVDEYGRCSSRYHELDCAHSVSTDWAASSPPRWTYQASLANAFRGFDLAAPVTVFDDPDDPDARPAAIPQRTLEFARQLAQDWGMLGDAPGPVPADSYMDLLRPETGPVSAYDALAEGTGYGSAPQPQMSRPGISELARELNLK